MLENFYSENYLVEFFFLKENQLILCEHPTMIKFIRQGYAKIENLTYFP